MFAWGTYILLHPGIFDDPVFFGLIRAAWWRPAEIAWGFTTVVLGMTRACALFVNGAYSRTPIIRLATSLFSGFIWAQIVGGFLATGRPSTGVVMYSAALILDLASAYRASLDVTVAEAGRRHSKGGISGELSHGSNGSAAGFANRG